jgi:hypothetical protein
MRLQGCKAEIRTPETMPRRHPDNARLPFLRRCYCRLSVPQCSVTCNSRRVRIRRDGASHTHRTEAAGGGVRLGQAGTGCRLLRIAPGTGFNGDIRYFGASTTHYDEIPGADIRRRLCHVGPVKKVVPESSLSQTRSTRPSGAPRFNMSGSACPCSVKDSDTEFRQWRSPVGGGPSGNT